MGRNNKVSASSRADVATALDIMVARTRRVPIDAHTIHCWKLDEDTGNYADEVVGGNVMVPRGTLVQGVAGIHGRACHITGTNGGCAQSGQGADPLTGFTASYWFRFTAAQTTNWQHHFRKEDEYHAWTGLQVVMGTYYDNANNLQLQVLYDATPHSLNVAIPTAKITLHTWHHIAWTITPNGGNFCVYFDGVLYAAPQAYPPAQIYWGTKPVGSTRGQWFFGEGPLNNNTAAINIIYDDIRVEDIARDATYIAAMWTNR